MKKLAFITLSALVLTGCASGLTESTPVEKRTDLNTICVRESFLRVPQPPKQILEYLEKSLARKNINTETYHSIKVPEHCKYALAVALKGKKVIFRGHLVLKEQSADGVLKELGGVTYRYRGDERETVKEQGIQGQFDRMIDELFKNY